jgi:hypothetical protein
VTSFDWRLDWVLKDPPSARLYLFQSLWSERVYSWYRQPDEFWFSAVAMTFAVLVGVGILVWGLARIPLPFGR